MEKSLLQSSLLVKYLKLYEKSPRSRAFAPLAEAYRSLGMVDKALEILKKNISHHPNYTMGYIVLGACYVDIGQYPLAYATLRPIVARERDNFRLQKLFGWVCENLDNKEEALETYKALLFLNPKDLEIAAKVEFLSKHDRPIIDLESELISDENGLSVESTKIENDEDRGFLVATFNNSNSPNIQEVKKSEVDELSLWKEFNFKKDVNTSKESLEGEKLDTDKLRQEIQIESKSENKIESKNTTPPLMTHTLVDLYLRQGHVQKGIEILEQIILKNPQDQRSKDRLEKLQQEYNSNIKIDENKLEQKTDKKDADVIIKKAASLLAECDDNESQEKNTDALMDFFDKKVKNIDELFFKEEEEKKKANLKHKQKLESLLIAIKERAEDKKKNAEKI